MTEWFDAAKRWARAVKRDVVALWVAARDRRTPLIAKVFAAVVAAYALSPIDLIPDFIPVLGYLDDVILVPLGILLTVRMIPPGLMSEFRTASEQLQSRPTSRRGLFVIVGIWAGLALTSAWLTWDYFSPCSRRLSRQIYPPSRAAALAGDTGNGTERAGGAIGAGGMSRERTTASG